MRLINYCLGGKADEIYKNTESKSSINSTVKNFLIDNEVLIILTLCKDFNEPTTDIVIQRNFLIGKKKKICTINDCPFSNMENFKKDFKTIFVYSNKCKKKYSKYMQ